MKVIRFETPDRIVHYGRVVDDHNAFRLEGHPLTGLRETNERCAVARLLPPIDPPNIFAIGRNYRAHAAETGSAVPEAPLIFAKPTTALLAPDGQICIPAAAPNEVDFEAELAVVIGRQAKNVSEADALSCVLGYCCANDVTARDCQRNDKQWTRGKGFDTFCPLGPCLVTADSISPDDLAIYCRLNGELMQSSRTSMMIFSCASLISYLSRAFTLLPGTIVLTGTPEGVGFARKPPIFLKSGDRIEVEIEGIGRLCNTVV